MAPIMVLGRGLPPPLPRLHKELLKVGKGGEWRGEGREGREGIWPPNIKSWIRQ